MRLYITALNPTDSVTDGFLPAAGELGCEVTVLTDQPEAFAANAIPCDVRDFRAVIDVIAHHDSPDAIFSNSDHLQAPTALAADYFGLPAKDWRAATRTKNKALMRRHLAEAGVEVVRSVRLGPGEGHDSRTTFPAVVKPREGVASEDVVLVESAAELEATIRTIRHRRPGETLVVEEYMPGPLHTLETLGDGTALWNLGGFATTLGARPYFIEERLDWAPREDAHVLQALAALGVGFGACHTEYVRTEAGPRVIEVNYRAIGDTCDFLLAELLGVPLFELILRVHLGEPLPADPPRKPGTHGAAVSELAPQSGTVISAPAELSRAGLWHRPMRRVGDRVTVTNTNRDYLGVIRAIGPDRGFVDRAIEGFRAANPWTIE